MLILVELLVKNTVLLFSNDKVIGNTSHMLGEMGWMRTCAVGHW